MAAQSSAFRSRGHVKTLISSLFLLRQIFGLFPSISTNFDKFLGEVFFCLDTVAEQSKRTLEPRGTGVAAGAAAQGGAARRRSVLREARGTAASCHWPHARGLISHHGNALPPHPRRAAQLDRLVSRFANSLTR